MKRTERHHLKENELANLTAGARDIVTGSSRQVIGGIVAIVVVLAAVLGYFSWRNRVEARAHTLLAQALAIEEARIGPPVAFGSQAPTGLSFVSQREKSQAALTKFKKVADEFPATEAGLFARYRQAATFMALGLPKNAAEAYQQVIGQGGTGHYAQMARPGLAEAQAQNGAVRSGDRHAHGSVAAQGWLAAGRRRADPARTRLRSRRERPPRRSRRSTACVQEFPDSPFTADARRELDQLKKS